MLLTANEQSKGEMRTVITFILPVLNRQHCIVRAIESCLKCESGRVEPRVLVIDGGSVDNTRETIIGRFATDSRVRLVNQPVEAPGFMAACHFGVENLDSELATFMYSDDVLSPEFIKLVETLLNAPDIALALGYGRQVREDELIEFSPMLNIRRIKTARVIGAYYGRVDILHGQSLPVSPVCGVFRSWVLRSWLGHVESFEGMNILRHHALTRLAVGPDLMIYLTALIYGGQEVIVTDEVVAQLTASIDSITNVGNREMPLLVGYWLARVWGYYQLLEKRQPDKLIAQCGGYVIAVWLAIIVKKLMRGEPNWIPVLFSELGGILRSLLRRRLLLRSAVAFWLSIWMRGRMMLTK